MEDPYYEEQIYMEEDQYKEFEEEYIQYSDPEIEYEPEFEEPEEPEEPEFQPEVKVAERTSKLGIAPMIVDKSLYYRTRSMTEAAYNEIGMLLEIYITNKQDPVYIELENKLTGIDNVQYYNPLLLVAAGLFNYYNPKFTKTTFNLFIREYEIPVSKEDLVRYIRLIRRVL